MKRILPILVLSLFLCACGAKKAIKAKKAYEIGEYDRAEKLFVKAVKSEKVKTNKAQYAFFLAECYRKKGLYKKAASQYLVAQKNKYKDNDLYLYIADCYLAAGQPDKAEEYYILYKTVASTKANIAEAGIKSCEQVRANAKALKEYDFKNPPDTGYIVLPMKAFNSKSSDYSPAYVGDDYDVVYFTSMRSVKKRSKINRVTGQTNSSIFMSKIDGGGDWTEPERLGEPFNSKYDDGTPSLTSDGKTMYFTRCPYDPTRENNAECYESRRSGGVWSEPVRVLPGGDSTMMVAHPAISPDGQTLYFVSDKKGSIGGKDIWYTTKNADGTWSEAVNAGGIVNTRGDEMFPYVRDNDDLYFSSNGHIGFGGLDIYKATRTETGRFEVTNMGLPINSVGDDFGIVFKGNKEEGLFTSGRQKAGIDKIYSFILPDVVLMCDGKLTDSDGNLLKRAYIKIIGSDGTNLKLRPNDDGLFGFKADPDVVYLIQCGARGYISQKMTVDTRGKKRSETVNINVKLEPSK